MGIVRLWVKYLLASPRVQWQVRSGFSFLSTTCLLESSLTYAPWRMIMLSIALYHVLQMLIYPNRISANSKTGKINAWWDLTKRSATSWGNPKLHLNFTYLQIHTGYRKRSQNSMSINRKSPLNESRLTSFNCILYNYRTFVCGRIFCKAILRR